VAGACIWNRTTTIGSSAKMKPFALTAVALVPLVVGALIGGWALRSGSWSAQCLGESWAPEPTPTPTRTPARVALVILATYTSPLEIGAVLVGCVFFYYVLPRVLIPALGRWMTRRRGGPPSERVTRTSTAIMAVMLTAFVIAVSWNRDLGRPTVGVLLALVVGVLFGLWRVSRRGD
jgi:uncharacterized membrane protein YqjE